MDSPSVARPDARDAKTQRHAGLQDLLARVEAPDWRSDEGLVRLLMQMARAHDAEDAAMMGEPSPWVTVSEPPTLEDVVWAQDRTAAMREALLALLPSEEQPSGQGEGPSDE